MNNGYSGLEAHCVVCTITIPPGRAKHGSVTCSKEHSIMRQQALRAKKDAKFCRYCRRPVTPEQQLQYHRWRKFLPTSAGIAAAEAMLTKLPLLMEGMTPQAQKVFEREARKGLDFLRGQGQEEGHGEEPSNTTGAIITEEATPGGDDDEDEDDE